MTKNIDLTTGSPFSQLILFSLPLVASSIFQQFYNFIDTLIIGRLLGVQSLAAVGIYYPLSFLILGFIQGSCVGFTIPLAQSIGAKNELDSKRYITSGTIICTILALIITPLMIGFTPQMLTLLNTPSDIFKLAVIFSTVSFIGIPANILYNYSTNILRSFGDSIHPFYFLLGSLILNIALDLIFILVFHLGIASVALATVISEFAAGILNVLYLIFHDEIANFLDLRMKVPFQYIKRVCYVGFPMGLEYSVSAIGAVLLQDAINQLGTMAVAAQSAGDKIRQLFTLPMESVGMSIATYTAQNFGSKNIARIKAGIKSGIIIQGGYSLISLLVILVTKHWLIATVIGTTRGTVYAKTDQYLTTISFFFLLHGLLMIFRNTIQGLGYSMYAIISGMGELIGRACAGYLAVAGWGFTAICYSNQLAWSLALLYCLFMTWWLFQHSAKLSIA